MLYIFTETPYYYFSCLFMCLYLENDLNINSIFTIDINEIDKENDSVIVYGVKESKKCYEHGIKNIFLNKPHVYDMLDNKANCFYFIKRETTIPVINTLVVENADIEDMQNFILQNHENNLFIFKEVNALDSYKIEVKTRDQARIDVVNKKKIYKNYIIQPYLEGYSLYNCNLLAVKGEVIEYLVITQSNNFEVNNIFGRNLFKTNRYILDSSNPYYNKILNYSKQIITTCEYNGFADIEFMCRGDEVLFLEINPRMSGQIWTLIEGEPIYIDYLVLNMIYYLEKDNKKKKRIQKMLEGNDKKYNRTDSNKLLASNITGIFKFLFIFSVFFVVVLLVLLVLKLVLKKRHIANIKKMLKFK